MNWGRINLLFLCLTFVAIQSSWGQWKSITIDVLGLTCSQCSKSVEVSLKKLAFVEQVEMDLANTKAHVRLKAAQKADVFKIAKAVSDAGFSVGSLSAAFSVEQVFNAINCAKVGGNTLTKNEGKEWMEHKTYSAALIHEKLMSKELYKAQKQKLKKACNDANAILVSIKD